MSLFIVVETMGRQCGNLAVVTALAAGAELAVIPERGVLDESKMHGIAARLEKSLLRGRSHAIVVVAEGVHIEPPASVGPGHALGTYLECFFAPAAERNGVEVRTCVLGHMQRGGRPSIFDRILAARFAESVWDCLAHASGSSGVLGVRDGRIHLTPFDNRGEAVLPKHVETETDLYGMVKAVSAWYCAGILETT